jgi:glutaconyl-CoA/methylmalonyl-CoA decarboxylase subunit gamma
MKSLLPVTIDGQTFLVEIEDLNAHPIVVRVDGERFEVWPGGQHPEDQQALATQAPAAVSRSPVANIPAPADLPVGGPVTNSVRAPIPGVIIAVRVRPGDSVLRAQELFTIEAMKMRNAIRATQPGLVGDVLVSLGQTVNYNDLLMTYAEPQK